MPWRKILASGRPFRFCGRYFWARVYEGRRREIVVCHEASHVRHRHSAERIALELVRSLFWFNPFVWIAGRWLSEVQEWEADRDVLDAGYGLTEYRTIIFRQLFGYNPDIVCGLNRSLTKNRFAMMTQFTKRRFAFVRFGAAIPVVARMMMLCSFTTKTSGSSEPGTASPHPYLRRRDGDVQRASRIHRPTGGLCRGRTRQTFRVRPCGPCRCS